MRTFDLAPLYRSTVGFDRLFSMLDGFDAAPGYPPYNIERTGENDYRITVAVAGFGENELSIEAKENTLTIKGEKQVKEEKAGEVLYQGIAARAFERVFQLADYVQVKGASSRTVSCTSTSCARSPRRRSRARSPSATARPSRRWSRPRPRLTQQLTSLSGSSAEWSAPGCPRGAFILSERYQCGTSSRAGVSPASQARRRAAGGGASGRRRRLRFGSGRCRRVRRLRQRRALGGARGGARAPACGLAGLASVEPAPRAAGSAPAAAAACRSRPGSVASMRRAVGRVGAPSSSACGASTARRRTRRGRSRRCAR